MKGLAFVAISTLAVAGCAGTPAKKAAVCDGKHRRPANVYGSVLPTLPIPVPASQSGARSMVAPEAGSPSSEPTAAPVFPSVDKSQPAHGPRLSRRNIARSYSSC